MADTKKAVAVHEIHLSKDKVVQPGGVFSGPTPLVDKLIGDEAAKKYTEASQTVVTADEDDL